MSAGKKKSAAVSGSKVLVRQIRSAIGRDPKFKGTLDALGLGLIGKSSELVASPTIVGMLKRVETVVEISKIK